MNRIKILIALLVAIFAIAAVLILRNQSPPAKKEIAVASAPTPHAPIVVQASAPAPVMQENTPAPTPTEQAPKPAQANPKPQTAASQNQSAPLDEPHRDLMARAALR